MRNEDGHSFPYILLLTVIASLSGLMFGLDTGIIGGAQNFIYHSFSIVQNDVFDRACTVASVPFGALVGAVLSMYTSMYYGRRTSLFVTGIAYMVGILFIISIPSIWSVIVGRSIMGFAIGLSCVIVPMYLGEVSPYEIRGATIYTFQLAITVGILLSYLINYIFSDSGNWHAVFASCLIPAVLLILGLFFLPRSPRWLMQQGRKKDAQSILMKLRGTDNVLHEINEIQMSIEHTSFKVKDLFNRRLFPLLLISFSLFVFQQLSGVNVIFYYVTTIFHQSQPSIQSDLMASMLTAAVNVIATIFGIWLIDKIGRRKLILIGMSGVFISLVSIALCFREAFGSISGTINIFSILLFIAFFAISLGGIPFIITSEIFPLNVRHLGMSVASFANWIFNTFVAFSFLYFVKIMGLSNTYIFYATTTLIGLFLMYFFLPETKNISIEKIESHLFEGKKLRYLGRQKFEGMR